MLNDNERKILERLVEKPNIRRTYESLLGMVGDGDRSMRAGGTQICRRCSVTQPTKNKHVAILETCGVLIVRQYDNGEPNEYLFPKLTERLIEKLLLYRSEVKRPWREIIGSSDNTMYCEADGTPIERSIIESQWNEAKKRTLELMNT